MADGYGVYAALARAAPHLTLVNCWAHVRRKFIEIESHYPEKAREVLDLLGELYAIERLVPATRLPEEPDTAAQRLAMRTQLRQERSRLVVEKIRQWAAVQRPLPRSGLGQAISYMLELWPGLTRFLEDPRIPLDNNPVERALRGLVVGRKNHYGSRSRRGCEVAALFYTAFETAKLCGVEPKTYLLNAVSAAIDNPGSATLPKPLPI